jgi:hypothetical protein
MRWVYLTLIILLVAATLIFILQNREAVTMSFLGFQHPRAARSPDCGRLRHRGCNGRQLVCASASFL